MKLKNKRLGVKATADATVAEPEDRRWQAVVVIPWERGSKTPRWLWSSAKIPRPKPRDRAGDDYYADGVKLLFWMKFHWGTQENLIVCSSDFFSNGRPVIVERSADLEVMEGFAFQGKIPPEGFYPVDEGSPLAKFLRGIATVTFA